MLTVLQTAATLRLTSSGNLLPWLGPALRGLIARRFKTQVCRHSPIEQETTWRYCKGCPHMAECPYGQTLEPDPPPEAEVYRGQEDAARPFVMTPHYPAPSRGEPGLEIPLTVTFIGHAAARQITSFYAAATEAGRDPNAGIEPEHTTFEVILDPPAGSSALQWWLVDLPLSTDAICGVVPRVKVQLTGPLFLRAEDANGRHALITEPAFADLFRAALRTLGSLFALYDQRLPADFPGLKAAAQDVPLLESSFTSFRQPKWSNRTGKHAMLQGTIGSGVYGPVPLSLLKWMLWGGRLHVGPNRVAGAGGWRVAWSEERQNRVDASTSWHWSV